MNAITDFPEKITEKEKEGEDPLNVHKEMEKGTKCVVPFINVFVDIVHFIFFIPFSVVF